MSVQNAPSSQSSSSPGIAQASKMTWSASRGLWVMDPYGSPGMVMADTFEYATGNWSGYVASGAGGGSMSAVSTTRSNTGSQSLQVSPAASTRFLAKRKFSITPKKKLTFEGYFSFDSPVNTRFVHLQAQWNDDLAVQHIAVLRYDTFNQVWQYLPSTNTTAVGPYTNVPSGGTNLASGAWNYWTFTVDYANNLYSEFLSGVVGPWSPSAVSIPALTGGSGYSDMELSLGAENTASGAGAVYYDDIRVWESA